MEKYVDIDDLKTTQKKLQKVALVLIGSTQEHLSSAFSKLEKIPSRHLSGRFKNGIAKLEADMQMEVDLKPPKKARNESKLRRKSFNNWQPKSFRNQRSKFHPLPVVIANLSRGQCDTFHRVLRPLVDREVSTISRRISRAEGPAFLQISLLDGKPILRSRR